jgi:hypothetical protein
VWLAHRASVLFRPAFPVLAARFASEVCHRERRKEMRAARDAGVLDCRRGLPGPAGLSLSRGSGGTMLFDEAPSGVENRKSAISPASRARCLKPYSARPPMGDHFQAFNPSMRITARIESLPTAIGAWPERAPHGALHARAAMSLG